MPSEIKGLGAPSYLLCCMKDFREKITHIEKGNKKCSHIQRPNKDQMIKFQPKRSYCYLSFNTYSKATFELIVVALCPDKVGEGTDVSFWSFFDQMQCQYYWGKS